MISLSIYKSKESKPARFFGLLLFLMDSQHRKQISLNVFFDGPLLPLIHKSLHKASDKFFIDHFFVLVLDFLVL